jgi:hypothetical protein
MANGKQKVVGVVAAILIVVAVIAIVVQLRPERYTYNQTLIDTEAKTIFRQEFTAGEAVEFPIESPFSDGRNAYPVYQCNQDGTIFAYIPYTLGPEEEEAPPPPEMMMPKCPVCGSIDVIVPEIPEGQDSIKVDQDEIPVVRVE